MCEISNKNVFIMVGMPGSGKSTLAKRICEKLNCIYLSSDVFRNKFHNQNRYEKSSDAAFHSAKAKAYAYMYETALSHVLEGKKVVLDATHLDTKKRREVTQKLLSCTDPSAICFVLVNPSHEQIYARMCTCDNKNNVNESVFDGWKRVYTYFVEQEKKGIYSWPRKTNVVESIEYNELEIHLI